ncbi:MAG: phage tail protein I [Pseudomonadota bacterium]
MSDHLLPPNATPQERALSLATARLADMAVPIASLWRAGECPADLLPWLAWAMSVEEEWSLCVTEADQRALIARALDLHRHKGTAWAMRNALGVFGVEAEMIEWWQPEATGLQPYEFGIFAHLHRPVRPDQLLGDDTASAVGMAVARYKNARSHLAWIAFAVDLELPFGTASLARDLISIDRTAMRVRWFPAFDTTAADAEALDPDPFGQSRIVADGTVAPILFGRPFHLDRLPVDGFADLGLQLDLHLPYREGEWTGGIERAQVTAGSVSAAPAAAPLISASPVTASLSAVQVVPTIAATTGGILETTLDAGASPAMGLDMMACLDVVAADHVPLDLPMETIHA